MKRLLILLLLIPLFISAQFKVPDKLPGTYVFDYDNVLTIDQKAELNAKIVKLRDSSSVEMAIVVLNKLQGYTIDDVALAIFNTWGIGKDGLDNGLLYVVSPEGRTHRMETGYGMEGDISSIVAYNTIKLAEPYFKQGQYYEGITEVTDKVLIILNPTLKAQREAYAKELKIRAQKKARAVIDAIPYVLGIIVGLGLISWLIYIGYKSRQSKMAIRNQEEDHLRECLRLKASIDYIKRTTDIKAKNKVFDSIFEKADRAGVDISTYRSSYINNIRLLSSLLEQEMKMGKTPDALQVCKSLYKLISDCLDRLERIGISVRNLTVDLNSKSEKFKDMREDLPKLKRIFHHI